MNRKMLCRRVPHVVEAIRWTGDNRPEVEAFVAETEGAGVYWLSSPPQTFVLEGGVDPRNDPSVDVGQWLVREVGGIAVYDDRFYRDNYQPLDGARG